MVAAVVLALSITGDVRAVTFTWPKDATTVAPDSSAHELGPGVASYYGKELGGLPTASGEPFDPEGLTAAHRTLPIGTMVRVTHARNGRSVVVRINDRGPSLLHRIIDLSEEAAKRIGMRAAGTAVVHLELLK